jgi:hypothetical protein
VDNGFSIGIIEVGEDPGFEFILGCDANAAEHGSSLLGEEAFHKIEPGPMFRGKYKGKAALWLGGKPPVCFLGDVRGVVVEDQLDGGVRRISGVEFLEKPDELPRTMPILDTGMNLVSRSIPASRLSVPWRLYS